jgi:hypothetical protein
MDMTCMLERIQIIYNTNPSTIRKTIVIKRIGYRKHSCFVEACSTTRLKELYFIIYTFKRMEIEHFKKENK